jgi:hypothetical protein
MVEAQMKRPVLLLVAASAGAAVGLLLAGRLRRRSTACWDALPVTEDRAAELIQQYAPTLDEIAREGTRADRELSEACR